jgi:cytoskeleton protein RodZ
VATTPAAAPPRPVQVTLAAIRPVWLRVTVDGARALQREVAAGETLSFGGDRAVIVRSGDAGGVRVTLNGTDRGALGLRGWPLTVSITPDGIEPLTPTRPER